MLLAASSHVEVTIEKIVQYGATPTDSTDLQGVFQFYIVMSSFKISKTSYLYILAYYWQRRACFQPVLLFMCRSRVVRTASKS